MMMNETTPLVGGIYFDLGIEEPILLAILIYYAFMVGSLAIMELTGFGVPYSKFTTGRLAKMIPSVFGSRFPSRPSFIFIYLGPTVTAVVGHFVFTGLKEEATSQVYVTVLTVLTTFHYARRTTESAFMHIFSKGIPIFTFLFIALCGYALIALTMSYCASLIENYEFDFADPINIVGFILFIIGEIGNSFFHYQLRVARLSKGDQTAYATPAEIGIFFEKFGCPHYLAEILIWIGLGLLGRTLAHWGMAALATSYLSLRTISTIRWYKEEHGKDELAMFRPEDEAL